jgi:hypothetical protein
MGGDQQPQPPVGQRQADQAAEQGEDDPFGQHLADHAAGARSHGPADRHLLAPREPLDQQQVGHVGAGDQQHQEDRPDQQDQPGADLAADQLIGHRHQREAERRVQVRGERQGVAVADPQGLLAHGGQRRPRLQPRRQVEEAGPPLDRFLGEQRHLLRPRQPDLHVPEGEAEHVRHHADDGVGLSLQPDRLADDAWIPAETPPPEAGAQHHHVGSPLLILGRSEPAPEQRLDPPDVEELAADPLAVEHLGVPPLGEVEILVVIGGEGGEQPGLAQGAEAREGRRALLQPLFRRADPDPRHAAGIGVGERPQDDRVEQAEDRRVRPDPQPQGEDRDRREAGTVPQPAEAVLKVMPEVSEHRPSPRARTRGLLRYGTPCSRSTRRRLSKESRRGSHGHDDPRQRR